jgi:hypothetical protein
MRSKLLRKPNLTLVIVTKPPPELLGSLEAVSSTNVINYNKIGVRNETMLPLLPQCRGRYTYGYAIAQCIRGTS